MIQKKVDQWYRQYTWKHNTECKNRYPDFIRRIRLELQPMETKRLKHLKKELNSLSKLPNNKPKEIIACNLKFFDIVSKFQDEGYLMYQPPEKKDTCKLFNAIIKQCGRQTDWNPTQKGEKITKHNIMYGGIWGLSIRSASDWISLPKSYVQEFKMFPMFADITKSMPTATKKLWVTEMLAKAAIKNFTKEHMKVLLSCIEKLL